MSQLATFAAAEASHSCREGNFPEFYLIRTSSGNWLPATGSDGVARVLRWDILDVPWLAGYRRAVALPYQE